MMESEFNDNQRSKRIKRKIRPYGMHEWQWRAEKEGYKNRWQVSAKLTEVNWHCLNDWCKNNNLSFNRGINKLIATHPDLQKNA